MTTDHTVCPSEVTDAPNCPSCSGRGAEEPPRRQLGRNRAAVGGEQLTVGCCATRGRRIISQQARLEQLAGRESLAGWNSSISPRRSPGIEHTTPALRPATSSIAI